jgi:UDP-glucose 4-epimerase
MNVIILGSQGFIGSHLVAHSISKGHTVTGCDLVGEVGKGYRYQKISVLSADFDTLFSSEQFDVCINASGSGNVPYSINHPLSDFEANTIVVAKALDTIRKYQSSCRYVHISSAAVYGNPLALPVNEDMPLHPLSPYGWNKLMSEMLCREYHQLYGLRVIVLRPFSVYGNGLKKQLFWDICAKLQKEDESCLYGTGNESRDFIHVTDLVGLIDILIRNSTADFDVYNAASGIESTIRNVADVFEEYYNGKKKISFSGERRAGDPVNWRADIQKVGAVGFKPSVDLGDGIRQYAAWYNSTVK